MRTVVAILMMASASAVAAGATPCNMQLAFQQPDTDAPGGRTAVWSDESGSALLFAAALNVNTDGTRRSYSVDDFWGERTALNNVCNAMSDGCADLSKDQLRERRIATQQALAHGWPKEELERTKISSSIIPFKDGQPCPLVNGYLVSATALHEPRVTDVCDLSSYVDALVVPALVLPGGRSGFAERDAKVGDLVVAATPDGDTPVYGVAGDIGPSKKLGEGSIALNAALLGKTEEPTNYKTVRQWVVPRAIVVVFPKTRDAAAPYLEIDRIDASAKVKFEAWGGMDRLKACAKAYDAGH